jgi:hypothetical protein
MSESLVEEDDSSSNLLWLMSSTSRLILILPEEVVRAFVARFWPEGREMVTNANLKNVHHGIHADERGE